MTKSSVETTDEVVLITGAARRIGAELAAGLHRAGMRVIIHCRRSDAEARALAEKLNGIRADSAQALVADLLDAASVRQLARDSIDRWGRLDVLVNNASAFYATPVESIDEQVWDTMLGIHIKAPCLLAQLLTDELKNRRGCIVSVTDIHTDRPLKNYPAYSTAKAGLLTLTKALARELAPEIRCNAVAPGAILWPEQDDHAAQHQEIIARTALKREGTPHDVVGAVLFLIRDADYITGQVINVDGGRTLSN